MKCKKCNNEMKIIYGDDTCTSGSEFDGKDYAYNLYVCNKCKTICRENVWSNPGIVWIYFDNRTDFYGGTNNEYNKKRI